MELTKEYFDQQLNKRFTEQDFKFDTKLKFQTEELKKFTLDQTESLARMVNTGFEHVNFKLKEIVSRLDVKEELKEMDRKFTKLENVLNIEL
jgi:hypothetical protein